MKKGLMFLTVFTFLFALSSVVCARTFDETVPFEEGKKLSIKAYKGTIELVPGPENIIDIHAEIQADDEGDADYAKQTVEATKIVVKTWEGNVSIESDYDDVPYQSEGLFSKSQNLPFVHYRITAPESLILKIEDYKSRIIMGSFSGKLDLETYKGEISIKNFRGQSEVETYKGYGSIEVTGNIELNTYKGELGITLFALDDDCSFETYKGNITLSIPAAEGFELDCDLGKKGTLKNEFDATDTRAGEDVRKSFNKGGPRISFETYKGTLTIKKQ